MLASGGQVSATVMTAVAMQLNNGTIVSVISNWYNLNEHLFIYLNSTLLNFSSPDQWYQEFDGQYNSSVAVAALLFTDAKFDVCAALKRITS